MARTLQFDAKPARRRLLLRPGATSRKNQGTTGMGIYRCNQCGFVSEDALSAVGTKVPCAKCGTASTVYGTVFYVEKLVERYFAALREVAALKEAETPTDAATTPTTACLLYTSDAADERSSVDLGGRRIIKKKNIVDS